LKGNIAVDRPYLVVGETLLSVYWIPHLLGEQNELSRQAGAEMPIRPEMRGFYAREWPEISRKVRFERGGGVCQCCGRPHGESVRCLPDGRWFDAQRGTWRNGRGRLARWPDLVEVTRVRHTRVVLSAAHLDRDPRNNRLRNLKSLCQRCHQIHDRPYHRVQRRLTYLLRRALGDLFLGPYPRHFVGQMPQIIACLRA
jgi:hypothetical protein